MSPSEKDTRVRIKICGITRVADAHVAQRAGANALGMVFWQGSPRYVAKAAAAKISAVVADDVDLVGVFVNATPAEVSAQFRAVGLDAVQLHGDEDTRAFRPVVGPIIRAMSLASDLDVERALNLPKDVAVLIDAHDPVRRGGTGEHASWDRAAVVAAARPVILAGGLSAENVGEAIRAVRPWAVDVSSGVESAPGIKEAALIEAFIEAVREA